MSDTMTTYRRADGDTIGGEYSFVTSTEFFDDDHDPNELVEEVWRCVRRRTVVAPSPGCCTFDVDGDWCETDRDVEWMKDGDEWVPRCPVHLHGPTPEQVEAKPKEFN